MVLMAAETTPTTRRLFAVASFLLMGMVCLAQNTVSVSGDNLTLANIVDSINIQTSYKASYPNRINQQTPPFRLHLKDVSVDSLLKVCFADIALDYEVKKTTLSIFVKSNAVMVDGTVMNAGGEPLAGATISVKGTKRMMKTDDDGLFHLELLNPGSQLEITYTSYSPQVIRIDNRRPIKIVLRPLAVNMDAPVIRAYGRSSKRDNTESISDIKRMVLQQQPVDNLLASLEGRVPGFLVSQASGVTGSSYSMEIRGKSSIAQGSMPLVLLDGVPITVDNTVLGSIGAGSAQGTPGASLLNGVGYSDIESVEVLKDAAATAIYGSRGANGVVLITTRKSTTGQLRWTADVYSGINRAGRTPALMNTELFRATREEALRNDNQTFTNNNLPEVKLWDSTRYTDFKKMMIGNTAPVYNARLEVSGGTPRISFLASGSYRNETSVFPGHFVDNKGSVYGNLRYHSANHLFQLTLTEMYSRENNHLPTEDYTKYIYATPNTPSFLDSTGKYQWQQKGVHYTNLLAIQQNSYTAVTDNLFNHLTLSYRALHCLNFRLSLGYNATTVGEKSINPVAAEDPDFNLTGSYLRNHTEYFTTIIEPTAEYAKTLGKGRLEALVGATWQQQQFDLSSVNSYGYTSDALLGIPSAAPNTSRSENHTLYRYEAVFGRFSYNWQKKYILTLSGRRDGSSRFGPGRQFGNFGAASGAWIFGDEPFLKKWKWLSFGKLRVSYGTTGNDQIGDYKFAQAWLTTNTPVGYQGSQGVYPANAYNGNLAWEINHKLEGALDWGILKNRVLLSVAAYRNWSGNQLVYYTLPLQAGYPSVLTNLPAVVENKGLEFSLQTINIRRDSFQWSSSVVLTVPVNRLVSFPGLENSSYASTLAIGHSLHEVLGYQYNGVDPNTGLFSFRDVNKDGILNSQDILSVGDKDVRYYGGISNSLQYRHWLLDIFVEFRVQNGNNPLTQLYGNNPPGGLGYGFLNNQPLFVRTHWRSAGDESVLQRLTATSSSDAYKAIDNYLASGAKATDASFVRVKNISLNYRLPDRLLGKWHLFDARIYLQGQNLLTLTHYPFGDPETQNISVLPPLKTVVAGVRLNF